MNMWRIYIIIAAFILGLIDELFEVDAVWLGLFILVGIWIYKACREE